LHLQLKRKHWYGAVPLWSIRVEQHAPWFLPNSQ
jgi:hypothetical protein